MDYAQAMEFLKETKKYGSRPGLDSIRALLALLGDVQERVPVIHIAGTNGKGSVGALLAFALTESGYRTGHFSTPDVFAYEEEFQINGKPVEKERLARLFTAVSDCCGEMRRQGRAHPTRFEVETAAAFLLFYEEKCEIAIIETGMGGEMDATNLIRRPLVSVLTPIGMDHMDFLGGSIGEIAAAKCGIIKEGCPVVTAGQPKEAMDVIRSRCSLMHAPCRCVDADRAVRRIEICPEGGITFWRDDGEVIRVGLDGAFQAENALCALEVLRLLKAAYPRITRESVQNGWRRASWRGRFERIGRTPDVYLDGAHNPAAAARLRETLDLYFAGRRVVYLMGVLADKDDAGIAAQMFSPGDRVFTVTPDSPRALDGRVLEKRLSAQKINAFYCENTEDAISYALDEAQEQGVVVVFGTFTFLRAVRDSYEQIRRKKEGRKKISSGG